MSTLPLTLSSDDEDNDSTTNPNKKKTTENQKTKHNGTISTINTEERDDVGSDGEEDDMDDDFEFGGLLETDEPTFHLSPHHRSSSLTTPSSWSYKSALKMLQDNDSMGRGHLPERMDVASIIAAARSGLKKGGGNTANGGNGSAEESESESGESGSSSGSDSDSDSEDEGVDDAHTKQMERDTLTLRSSDPSGVKAGSSSKPSPQSESGTESESESEAQDDEAEERKLERQRANEYFETSNTTPLLHNHVQAFVQLNLSRPLLRGVASMGFVKPTPIQGKVIPVALGGRDVCASAVTGSGKTAAFLLPIMERILQRGGGRVHLSTSSNRHSQRARSLAAIKGLILTPTRELAAQCLGMMMAMAKFTSLRAVLVVGGAKNVAAQAAELRTRPDIVIATPGRLLDHLTNSSGVDLDDLEFLVLDEADRLLDLGFQDEVHEIVKSCPKERQTLLFSATMGTKVDDLIKLSLKRPVRIHITEKKRNTNGSVEVAERLEQEFIRIRSSNEGTPRQAILLSLLTRTFQSRTIVFFDTKSDAHRLMIICGLCGIRCAELHGNLTQIQRLEALERFREGLVDVLLATDLAARGLDISDVETVINFEMPSRVETYVHRIGRTARAGRGGKACTLIGEGRRHLMKEVIRDAGEKRTRIECKGGRDSAANSTGVIRSRTVPQAVLNHFVAKIQSLEPHIEEVKAAEAVAKMDRIAEMEATKVENLIQHGSEIKSRPQREWFATTKEKLSAKEAAALKQQQIAAKVGTGMHRMTRVKRRRRDAREELMEAQEEAKEEARKTGKKVKQAMMDGHQKSTVRAQKRELEKKSNEKKQTSIHDEDEIGERKKRKKEKPSKKHRGAFASDALGDASLFEEEAISHSKNGKNEELAKSQYNFRGFDPEMQQRKNKKKSNKGFKSKSKYKRR